MTVDLAYLGAAVLFLFGSWLSGYVAGLSIWAVKRLMDNL
jgi:hypothetical protein